MNRGSAVRPRMEAPRSAGFNEAPIHESGKFEEWEALDGSGPGFNEAPIHESGKCRSGSTPRSTTGGFNEAPIHESGKSF